MKFKKILMSLLVIISALFTTVVEAATPNSFNLVRDTSTIINYYEDIVKVEGSTHAIYFPLKYSSSGNYLVFCTGDRSANTESSLFTKKNFVNAYDGAVVAAIIKAGVGENATKNVSKSNIFFTQLAIWKSLPNTGAGFPATEGALSSSQRTLLNNLIYAGTTAKTRYNNIKNFSISFNATTLNFTLNGDVYESQVIKVSGNEIKTKTPSVNIGTVVEKDGGYVVRIAKNLLSIGKNTITLKVKATSNSISVASNYTNGKSGEQTTTITLFDDYSNSTEKSITGVINIEKEPVKISKVDATNQKELPGATLVLTYPDGHTYSWQSENTPKEFTDLQPGKYTLEEKYAPNGYILNEDKITFTVDKDGKVKEPVVMKNYPLGKTEISKQDATTGKELKGAKFVLTRPDGTKETWTSTTEPYVIKNLQPGKYTLVEEEAPKGYIKSDEKITFTVDKYGKVKEKFVVKNYKKGTTAISKVDATTGKELPGATLELTRPDGTKETWVSTTEPHMVTDLKPGKYTLKETIQPEGYKLSEEVIEFTVGKDGKVVEKIEMKNYPLGSVLISKQDITSKKELYGAYLEVYKEDGTLVEGWTSGKEPHVIEGLEKGKYYLIETQAPDEYVLSSEKIEFEIDENGNLKNGEKVIMYNEKKPYIPVDITSSFKSITTSIIGIITMVFGAIVIKKNYKKNEEK